MAKTELELQYKVVNAEFNKALKDINSDVTTLNKEFRLHTEQLRNTGSETDKYKSRLDKLNSELELAKKKTEQTNDAYKKSVELMGENSKEAKMWGGKLLDAQRNEERLKNAISDTNKELDDHTSKAKKASNNLKKLGDTAKSAGDKISSTGSTLTAGVTAPLITLGTVAVKSTADMEALEAQFEQTFEDAADQATDKVEELGDSFGMLPNRIKPAFTQTTAQFKGLGADTEEAMERSAQATTVAADASAFYDKSMEDAQSSLNSFIKGNYEGGESIGLFANETQMAAWASENLGVEWKDLSEKDKQFARLEFAEAMQESAGATGQAQRESESLSNQMGNLQQSAKDAFAEFGKPLLQPVIKILQDMSEAIKEVGDSFKKLSDEQQENIVKIGLIVAAIGPVLVVFGKLLSTFGTVLTIGSKVITIFSSLFSVFGGVGGVISGVGGALSALGGVLTTIITPALAIIGVIAGLVALFADAYNSSEEFRIKVDEAFLAIQETVGTVFGIIKETIETVITEVTTFVGEIFGSFVTWWNENHELILETVNTVWDEISMIIQTILDIIVPIIESAWNLISEVTDVVWPAIQETIRIVIETIQSIITTVMQIINGDWEGAWNTISNLASTIWEGIKSTVDNLINGLATIIGNVMDSISQTISDVWDAITSKTSEIWDGISNTISDVINGISDTVNDIFTGIKDFILGVWDDIKNGVSNAIQSISDKIDEIGDAIASFFSFDWVDIKLPHFSITGSINPFSSDFPPKIGIEWYAKGGIMNGATLFGMNGNTLLGGGEAGPEAILPLNKNILGDIGDGIAKSSRELMDLLSQKTEVGQSLVYVTMNNNISSDYDSDRAIRRLDRGLGELGIRKDRGGGRS